MNGARSLLLVAWLLPAIASAHQPSDSYLRLDSSGAWLTGEWAIALRDLEVIVGLDADGNRAITWGELKRRRGVIEGAARTHLELRAGGRACELAFDDLLVDEHAGNGYTVLRFGTDCPGGTALTVRYGLLFELDPQHRGLLRLGFPQATATAVFAPDSREQHFDPGVPARGTEFLTFLRAGMIHIWLGVDHLLFLLCLLLPAVLQHQNGRWNPVGSFGPAFRETVRVVTAFTAAHSITLALAALGIVSMPPRLVEPAIAASIVVAALNNLYPLIRHNVWSVAFAFGLLHGFGFANALRDLGLDGGAFALSLLGFNLGVEAGQLCLVAAWLPLAYGLRTLPVYRYGVLYGGSALVAVTGAVWLVRRVLL